jgi:hypothetical protein
MTFSPAALGKNVFIILSSHAVADFEQCDSR